MEQVKFIADVVSLQNRILNSSASGDLGFKRNNIQSTMCRYLLIFPIFVQTSGSGKTWCLFKNWSFLTSSSCAVLEQYLRRMFAVSMFVSLMCHLYYDLSQLSGGHLLQHRQQGMYPVLRRQLPARGGPGIRYIVVVSIHSTVSTVTMPRTLAWCVPPAPSPRWRPGRCTRPSARRSVCPAPGPSPGWPGDTLLSLVTPHNTDT